MTDKERQKRRRIARRFAEDPVPPRVHRAEDRVKDTRRDRGNG